MSNMSEEFVEIDVTAEALEYVPECLRMGGPIGAALLRTACPLEGRMLTFVPRIHADGYGRRLQWGFWMPWKETQKWAARWITNQAAERRDSTLLVVDATPDRPVKFPEGARQLRVSGDRTQYAVMSGAVASEASVSALLLSSGVLRGVVGVLSDSRISGGLEADNREVGSDWLDAFCAGTCAAVFDAFDGEGYVVWASARSGPPAG